MSTTDTSEGSLANLRVLLIDDDDDDHDLMRLALGEIDPQIQLAVARRCEGGIEFLNTTSHLPDYIFMDLHMPPVGGVECVRQLRGNEKFAAICIIFYTSIQMTEEEIASAGADGFLLKPFNLSSHIEELSLLFHKTQKTPRSKKLPGTDNVQESNA